MAACGRTAPRDTRPHRYRSGVEGFQIPKPDPRRGVVGRPECRRRLWPISSSRIRSVHGVLNFFHDGSPRSDHRRPRTEILHAGQDKTFQRSRAPFASSLTCPMALPQTLPKRSATIRHDIAARTRRNCRFHDSVIREVTERRTKNEERTSQSPERASIVSRTKIEAPRTKVEVSRTIMSFGECELPRSAPARP